MHLARRIDALIMRTGIGAAYLLFLILGIIVLDVIMHSVFGAPLAWTQDLVRWSLVFYIFLGGAYALQAGAFVRVDLLYARLTPRAQGLIDLTVSTGLVVLFLAVMINEGLAFGLHAFRIAETTATATWQGPVWPAKLVLPVGSALLGLAWLADAIRALDRLLASPPRDPATADASGA